MHSRTLVQSPLLTRVFSTRSSVARHQPQFDSAAAASRFLHSSAATPSTAQSSSVHTHAAGCGCGAHHRNHVTPSAASAAATLFESGRNVKSSAVAASTAASSQRTFSTAKPAFSSSSSSSSRPLMRAQVLTEVGADYQMGLEQLQRPVPKRGEVLVRVRACGVCHTDLHVMKAEVSFLTPAVMGHEISGEILEFGPETRPTTNLSVGSNVACPFIMPCAMCSYCTKGSEDLCSTFFAYNRGKGQLYDGSTRLYRQDGTPIAMYSFAGLAEYAIVPITAVFELPKNLPHVDAAILGCAVFTAYGAVQNVAALKRGENCAVLGVGGVGSNIIQIARAKGAKQIIAIDVSKEKLDLALKFGATHTINAATEKVDDRIRALTDTEGVDVAFEALGRTDTFVQALTSVSNGGRAVMVGIAPQGVMAPVEITRLVRRKIQLLGSYGARASTDMPALIQMVERGELDVSSAISQRFSLEEAGRAYALLDKGQIVGRAVIDMEK